MKLVFYKLLCLLMVALVYTSCTRDEPIGESFDEDNYTPRGALASASDVQNGFFDLLSIDNATDQFTIDAVGESVSGVDVYASFNGGAESLIQSVTSVPGQVSINAGQVLSTLGVDPSTIAVGDALSFTFNSLVGGENYRSNQSLTIPFSCSSNLEGTYDYVSTGLFATNGNPCPSGEVAGQVTFTALGGGRYQVSDLGFGQYGSSCWGDSPATSNDAVITDLCNSLTTGGLDQYGLTYIWSITSIEGPNLFISWTNDYGDGGDVVITRPDGSDWPQLFTN